MNNEERKRRFVVLRAPERENADPPEPLYFDTYPDANQYVLGNARRVTDFYCENRVTIADMVIWSRGDTYTICGDTSR